MKKIYLALLVAAAVFADHHKLAAQVNLPCFADFTISSASFTVDTVCVGIPVQFIDQSSSPGGPMTLFVWDFGDGSSPMFDQNPVHTFTTAGTFGVILNASDGAGCSDQIIKNIKVIGKPFVDSYSRILPSCVGDCDGEVTVNFSGPLPISAYNVSWIGSPSTGTTIYSLCSGLYEAIIADQYGCTDEETSGTFLPDPQPVIANIFVNGVGLVGCDGDLVELTADVNGGTGPYTVNWNTELGTGVFSDPNALVTDFQLVDFSDFGGFLDVTLSVSDANGCFASNMMQAYNYSSQISGIVTISNTGQPCAFCPIEVYQWSSEFGVWQDVSDGATTDADGFYSVSVSPYEEYIVRAAPDPIVYANTCPTYAGNTHLFNLANQYNSSCDDIITADIEVIGWMTTTGSCTVTGTVYGWLPGFPQKVQEEDPIPLIDVVVEKVPPGGSFIMGHDITDANGNYSFSFLPETAGAEYYVYVDVPGVPHGSGQVYVIEVGPGDVLIENLDYCITNDPSEWTVAEVIMCNITSVKVTNIADGTFELLAGPNPSMGLVDVSVSSVSASNTGRLSVLDLAGRSVLNLPINVSKTKLDLRHLPAGIYTLQAEVNGMRKAVKLVLATQVK